MRLEPPFVDSGGGCGWCCRRFGCGGHGDTGDVATSVELGGLSSSPLMVVVVEKVLMLVLDA